MLRYILTGLMFSLVLVANAAAAPEVTREILTSKVLGEDRPLNIVLPVDYSPDKTYPVVYALDGGGRRLPDLAERMQSAHAELIVVGVENVDRSRDMFPEPLPARENRGGGGENFLVFLTTELIPHIESRYATNGYRVISGQSNSGFFVIYALLNATDTFDAYLAGSPMIGWDQDMIHSGTRALLVGKKTFPKTLFMNQGDDDLDRVTDFLPAYEALLDEVAPSDFRWMNEFIQDGGHVPASTYHNGIAFIFGEG
jgi:predicted alpha/beta superfamily hydrolase